jgi:hypothetical protein
MSTIGGEGALFVGISGCRSDIEAMAIPLQLEQLTVYTIDGTFYFSGPEDFLPIRNGGKGWR